MARGTLRAAMSSGLAERVKEARAHRTPLRITGAGTWMDAGRSVAATTRLDVSSFTGIVDYVPGDLTLTARAGTSLDEIQRVTAREDQWLTLDPNGSGAASLGATVATASAGPLSSAFGTPRDHVLGCEFVTGAGEVVRAGGRVVKNVAGFDLVRLVTGSWGTIGALTEVSVRLRARPEADVSMSVAVAGRAPDAFAHAVISWMRSSHLSPVAAELVSPALARHLGHDGAGMIVRWGGNAAFARAATDDAASLGELRPADNTTWGALSRADGAEAFTFRLSTLPSRLPALWARASEFAHRAGGFAHATVSRGVVRCIVPAGGVLSQAALHAELAPLAAGATAIGERLPAQAWPLFSRSRPSDSLRAGVKRAFDPDGVMNPGILGGS